MVAKINTGAVIGLIAQLIEVEADILNGLPTMVIVGLPDTAIQESRERIRAALKNSGMSLPVGRLSVNLAPADFPKVGTHYDLPIAVGLLVASGQITLRETNCFYLGELSLDGRLKPVSAVLPLILKAKQLGITKIFLPKDNCQEAALVVGLDLYPLENLVDYIDHCLGLKVIEPTRSGTKRLSSVFQPVVDFLDIKGHVLAKQALMVAAAGNHNILMSGPPGSGKTMLAQAVAGILPELSTEEMVELTAIYSISGENFGSVISQRPVRTPHHSSSMAALVGGGTLPKPGEISLSHKGILFLDELPEFSRLALESLRQPLENGLVTISRARLSAVFPAQFLLIAAMNPCPCGLAYGQSGRCICSPVVLKNYKNKISGPLLDRIDIQITVPNLSYKELSGEVNNKGNLPSQQIKQRVSNARQLQSMRLGKGRTNNQMTSAEVEKYCHLSAETDLLMEKAANKFHLSGRAIFRILKVARTIADLSSLENVKTEHLLQALNYRQAL